MLTGAAAALGAAGIARAVPAAAAARPLLIGRTNYATPSGTALKTTSTAAAFWVEQRGNGHGLRVLNNNTHATVTSTGSNRRWGLWAMNTAATPGPGGAVRADGERNIGLMATTAGAYVPALRGRGSGGAGSVALLAEGSSYLDGDALLLRGYVGVAQGPGSARYLSYAAVVSGETALHSSAGKVTLDGAGAADVDLGVPFAQAVVMSGLSIALTPQNVAMPNLHVVPPASGSTAFQIRSGAAGGVVHWQAVAPRYLVLDADAATAQAPTRADARRARERLDRSG